MKKGDIVKITKQEKGGSEFFSKGDKAILLYKDDDGDWWADFTMNEDFYSHGKWCLQKSVGTEYIKEA